MPASQPLSGLRLHLHRSDTQEAALGALLHAQQTPGDPKYRKWLTPEEFRAEFAQDESARTAAEAWLQAKGFRVAGTTPDGMWVRFSGTAEQVERAFALRLRAQVSGNALTVAAAEPVTSTSLPMQSFHAEQLGGLAADANTALAEALEDYSAAVVVAPVTNAKEAVEREALLAEATAQGMTVLQADGGTVDVPEASAAVLVEAKSSENPFTLALTRPEWQTARGLPADGLRAAPDALLRGTAELAQSLNAFAVQHGRVGPLAPQLYRFASVEGVFTHDGTAAPAGTWTAGDGLGTLHTAALLKAMASALAAPTVLLTSTAEAVVPNSAVQRYDLAVTVAAPSGSTATPTGFVSVQDNGATVATVQLSGGVGTYTLSLSGSGHSLVAVYAGDTNYSGASSTAVTVNVPLITTTVALTGSPTSVAFGSAVSLTASVTPALYVAAGAPTGQVMFKSSLQGVFATATLGNGYVTFPATTLQVGTHSVTAVYVGDSNYGTSTSSPLSIQVTQGRVPSTAVISVLPAQPQAGQNTVVTATVTPNVSVAAGSVALSLTCSGKVIFYSNNAQIGTGILSAGAATITAQLPSGVDSLTASYGGDTLCYSVTSSPLLVSPTKVASALSLVPAVTQANAGQTIQISVTAAAADPTTLGVPSGTVTVYDLRSGVQTPVGTATLTNSGVKNSIATVNVDGSVGGVHTFSAGYGGDTTFVASTTGTATVTFGDFAATFSPATTEIKAGGSAKANVTVTASSGFTGTVVLSCAVPASSQMGCDFSPSSVTVGGASVLTVTTRAYASVERPALLPGVGGVVAALLLLPFGRMRRLAGLLVLVACAALGSGGCGTGVSTDGAISGGSGATGGSASVGTPLGTQLVTVTLASADGTLRHTYTFSVTVQ